MFGPFLRLTRPLSVFLALAGLGLSAPALAVGVSPLVVEANEANSGTDSRFTVDNADEFPVPIEVVISRIKIGVNGEIETIPGGENDLVILPPAVLLQPGQAQAFRVQYVGPAMTESQSYFVSVNQVPVDTGGETGVQVVYNFRVLVNVAPLVGETALSFIGAEVVTVDGKARPAITVRNAGNKHALMSLLTSLKIQQMDAGGKVVFEEKLEGGRLSDVFGIGLVMPRSDRRFVLPIDLPQGGGSLAFEVGDAE